MHRAVLLLLLTLGIFFQIPSPASGSFDFFTDFQSYQQASGTLVLTSFLGVPAGEVVTDQYLSQGIRFTDGDDIARESGGFVNDGRGLYGGTTTPNSIGLQLSQPTYSIGIAFPGALRLDVFDQQGGTLQGRFDHGLSGTGFFAGIVSDDPFQFVSLSDWVDGSVNIDDLYSSSSQATVVPEPASILLLLSVCLLALVIRRKS